MAERVVRFVPGKSYVYAISSRNHARVLCTRRTRCYASFKIDGAYNEVRKKIHIGLPTESLDGTSVYPEIVRLARHTVYADWEW